MKRFFEKVENIPYFMSYLTNDEYEIFQHTHFPYVYKIQTKKFIEENQPVYVTHCLNRENLEYAKEIIWCGFDDHFDVFEHFVNLKNYDFGGMEIFSHFFVENVLSHIDCPQEVKLIFSSPKNFEVLERNGFVRENVIPVYNSSMKRNDIDDDNCFSPSNLWKNLEEDYNDEKNGSSSEKHPFMDDLYHFSHLGDHGEHNFHKINKDKTLSYKRGTANNVHYAGNSVINLNFSDENAKYERLKHYVKQQIEINGSELEKLKKIIYFLLDNNEEIYKNFGISINNNTINKIIKMVWD